MFKHIYNMLCDTHYKSEERAAGWRESNLLKFDGEIGIVGTSNL